MKRVALEDLKQWYEQKVSKPLIIRGARQVGKSTLVKLFCAENNLELIEINLEIERINSVNKEEFSIDEILDELQLKKQKTIQKNTLIFFDEIQENPKLLKALRYFYEKAPHLKIIAAGSLLEIALRSESFSFPVGRVEFYHLGPMSFQEFLWATDNSFLNEKLERGEFSYAVHELAKKELRNYLYIGGMPEAVKSYAETKSIIHIRKIQQQLLQTYQADFPKYNKRMNVNRIERVFASICNHIGEKLIYTKIDNDSASRDIKRVIELLIDARVIIPCFHTSGNNHPLKGEIDEKIFKVYFLDIGLVGAMMNIDFNTIEMEINNNFNFKGKLAEQFVAQHLAYINGPEFAPALFYHLRDKGTQKAEIDFLVEIGEKIIPVEVKSSSLGHLKSLHYFCNDKKSKIAIKTSLSKYSKNMNFSKANTELSEIPLYAVDKIRLYF